MVRLTNPTVKKLTTALSHSRYGTTLERKDIAWSILLTCEHASNVTPEFRPEWMWGPNDWKNRLPFKHWGVDIGAEELTLDIIKCMELTNDQQATMIKSIPKEKEGCLAAICAEYTRLLLDCNRPFGSDTMFRKECDGIPVDINADLSDFQKQIRKKHLYDPYHDAISKIVEEESPKLIFSVHSFNPEYEGEKRSMEVGILFNDSSENIGKLITEKLVADGIKAEENQPWSGKEGFMYSAEMHAAQSNGRSLPLMIEVRNDVLQDIVAKKNIVESLVKALMSEEIFPYCSVATQDL